MKGQFRGIKLFLYCLKYTKISNSRRSTYSMFLPCPSLWGKSVRKRWPEMDLGFPYQGTRGPLIQISGGHFSFYGDKIEIIEKLPGMPFHMFNLTSIIIWRCTITFEDVHIKTTVTVVYFDATMFFFWPKVCTCIDFSMNTQE